MQEKNQSLRTDEKLKEEQLKQRENGFQVYVNGPHTPSRRPSTAASGKRTVRSSNHLQTPLPFPPASLSSNHRSQWLSPNQIEIQTYEGPIISDVHSASPSRTLPNITYRLDNVDQSWMPQWYSQMQSPLLSSLSLEDIPTKNQQQLTYRLPTLVSR